MIIVTQFYVFQCFFLIDSLLSITGVDVYSQGQELDKDYKENIVELHKLETEVSELKGKNQQLRQDNESLEAGLKEVMEALQKGVADGKYGMS